MMSDLTSREVDVCVQICKGLSHKEIAANLHISFGTVKCHIVRIGTKLGLHRNGRQHFLVTIFIAKQLMEAAQKYPLIRAALEL